MNYTWLGLAVISCLYIPSLVGVIIGGVLMYVTMQKMHFEKLEKSVVRVTYAYLCILASLLYWQVIMPILLNVV